MQSGSANTLSAKSWLLAVCLTLHACRTVWMAEEEEGMAQMHTRRRRPQEAEAA